MPSLSSSSPVSDVDAAVRPRTLEDYGLTPEIVARKIARYCELRSIGRQLALAGIRFQNPEATAAEVARLFAARLEPSRLEKWKGACDQPTPLPE